MRNRDSPRCRRRCRRLHSGLLRYCGLPTVWIPHSYAACSQHAPDEHALVPILREGLAIMGGLLTVEGYGVGNLARWIPRTGGGPSRSGKDDAAHAVWIKHERPDVWDATRWLLPSKDYLNLRLCGEAAASIDFSCTVLGTGIALPSGALPVLTDT